MQSATTSPHSEPLAAGLTFEGTTWPTFQRLGKDFLDVLPTAGLEEAEAGWKCLGLAYLACAYDESDPRQVNARDVQAPVLLKLLGAKFIERQVELEGAARAERGPTL